MKYLLGLAMIDTVINEVLLGRDLKNENAVGLSVVGNSIVYLYIYHLKEVSFKA